jgi:beta-galactosidase
VLPPGWHHIAGVYDGKKIGLYVDGDLADEQTGSGAILTNDVDVAIGKLPAAAAGFSGTIDEVRISDVARSPQWLNTQYLNQQSPSTFIRSQREERAP